MADKSSATHVFLLGTLTQTNSILPELLTTKLTLNTIYSAIAGDFENNLNNSLQKIDSNKDFVLVVFLDSSIIAKDRALRDAVYNFHSHVKAVIVGDGSEEGLGLESKRSDVLLFKMEGYMDALTSDAIRLTDATVIKSSKNKTHDCFVGTDQNNLSLFHRLEGAEKLLKQINIQLSPVGDQANTEFIIDKLLPFSQGVENVGMVAGGKVEMFNNLLRPKLKCKDPNALCVVVILDVLCFKSVYEVESSNECILSHMCTMFSQEMDDNNATITRAKHFCCKGFVIDILISLERDLDFKAEVYIVEDGKYGVYDRNSKRWCGMIGDLIDGKAELALTSLELSLAREEVIDYSNVPLMYHDRVIVMAVKSSYTSHDWFGFTKPFSTTLWITFGAASVILVIVVWLIDKYSPYGHKHHFQVFTLRDSFSYLSSTVFKINLDDVTARSPSARFTYAVFSFGTLVLISTYTANLMVSLMEVKVKFPITGIRDPKASLITSHSVRNKILPAHLTAAHPDSPYAYP
ncbi:uncharacterized protein LOC5520475 isoform X2 [Nematostella vectensis]|nr:uncharacterized protein LOC5520475 isoform X2 [Nematostella vectensis]